MKKWFPILLIATFLSSCRSETGNLLKQAASLIENSPEEALNCLDSIKDHSKLNTENQAHYTFLKYQALFLRDGELNTYVPIPEQSLYWEKQKEWKKAAYSYLFNGILSEHSHLYEQAALCYNKAQKLALQEKDSSLLFYIFYYQGKLLLKNQERQEGRETLQKALDFHGFQNMNDDPVLLLKIAECYLYTQKYEEARNCYQEIRLNMDSGRDSTLTIKALFQVSQKVRNKKLKKRLSKYLSSNFIKDTTAQIYSKLVDAEIFLKNRQWDSVRHRLNAIPKEKISHLPEILLNYYRIQGNLYLHTGDIKQAQRNFQNYIQYTDDIKTTLFNTRIQNIVNEYHQAQLTNEVNILHNKQIYSGLAIIILLLICGLTITLIYLIKKKKQEQLSEKEMLIEVLQHLCNNQESKKKEIKQILLNKLQIQRKLVYLSSQEIPKNKSFLKMYNEMIENIHSTGIDWEEFYELINGIYDDFHKKMTDQCPGLSEKEIQTCCLLCGGFSTEEIAFVMNQTIFSVNKRKTTIRKKLKLEDRADIISSLMKFLKNVSFQEADRRFAD